MVGGRTEKKHTRRWSGVRLRKLAYGSYWRGLGFKLLMYAVLIELAFVFLYPFVYMIITSLKTYSDLNDITVRWIPKSLHWINYARAYDTLNYLPYFKNSVFVTALCTAGHLLSCSFVAYGFARFRFPFRNVLFGAVLLTFIIPVQTVVIAQYLNFSQLKWIGTYLPLIVPTFFGFGLQGGLFIFIFRQFFLGLPYELEDVARIDGCNSFSMFFRIMFPISKSSILVSAVFSMVWHWNEYYETTLYITKSSKFLLPQILPQLYDFILTKASNYKGIEMRLIYNDAVVMAATFLVILPLLAVYFVLQKHFATGIERTGLIE